MPVGRASQNLQQCRLKGLHFIFLLAHLSQRLINPIKSFIFTLNLYLIAFIIFALNIGHQYHFELFNLQMKKVHLFNKWCVLKTVT